MVRPFLIPPLLILTLLVPLFSRTSILRFPPNCLRMPLCMVWEKTHSHMGSSCTLVTLTHCTPLTFQPLISMPICMDRTLCTWISETQVARLLHMVFCCSIAMEWMFSTQELLLHTRLLEGFSTFTSFLGLVL